VANHHSKSSWTSFIPAIAVLTLAAGTFAATMAFDRASRSQPQGAAQAEIPEQPRTNHPVFIRTPETGPSILAGRTNFAGEPVTVSCSTCHATTTPNPTIRRGEDLQHFHQGLQFQHGNISCLSCHNANDYDTLRLADGSAVQFTQVMNLCSQCHGTQARDYQHGAHGGMTGHWDLSKGGRHRNNCIDCHDPHAPKFQPMLPVFAPRDRGTPSGSNSNGKH
jgi:formate-dependent nitrite reductase cytochrome c552 subunit